MKLKAEIKFRGRCKHCGKWLDFKDVSNHCAYEHEIYHSKWYEFKAKIRKVFVKGNNKGGSINDIK